MTLATWNKTRKGIAKMHIIPLLNEKESHGHYTWLGWNIDLYDDATYVYFTNRYSNEQKNFNTRQDAIGFVAAI